ncbi:CRISPR-associated protein Cas5 [Campylobacter hyointestinalis]|uniref:CRISPR-associated protein Cas5 n=1 Tax=Campylobacter hyointestinalis subsp. hyointestinalis TaxID=91352 RepID=A0A0S4SI19_CAMHY|nr:CRISPR-associated protein Cas5 [Campylobacter hyointestinalis]PPB69073.1 CRISPR-associated protein Cas5 [Campylobacter hyointestinalis subsp. hyointestinalis]PPB73388.1 CRISPR-associated protein Cas5 [Campylobacter hyointestinalis subsp. hyointestinalis]PPB75600.1 CRISPR-associated protein Cas5 [Campylobacter hyointestinalis subsp. hyointestinalis]PPB78259.1 CRISPR-associated protein Cas5 [Campylobacter hyointestinalis subsp. hyointestinalis]PPB78834.1 CRISPR-associated protein Cas5 [Campyl
MILGIKIWADYAHFSHPATIYSSLTYPIPPKTTVMGLLGCIIGENNYYFLNDISYACIIENIDGKSRFCFNGIKDALSELNIKKIEENSGFKQRRQFYRELLINPSYEIYLDLSKLSDKKIDIISNILRSEKSLFTPYLGINFCLAKYQFLGEFRASSSSQSAHINSFIPIDSDFELEFDKSYTDCRFATTVNSSREFGNFKTFLVETSGKSIKCNNITYYELNGKKVIFI